MPRVLIPVDGSECALRAVRYVVSLKGKLQEPLDAVLVNVQPPLPARELLLETRAAEVRRLEEPIRAHGESVLTPARAVLDAATTESKSLVEIGEPAPAIAALAKTYHCDMIVMGTRGLGALETLFLGSVATKVLHQSSVPVLLVR